ncbi:unnamed protein product [Camellia sinensis]
MHPNFRSVVQKAWSESLAQRWAGFRIKMKLCGLKPELKRWNLEEFGIVESQLKKAEEELHALELMAESRVLETQESAVRREVRNLVRELRKKMDLIWFQKSRLNWAQNGDRNTRFFHIMANKRQRRNLVDSVVVDGIRVEELVLVREAVLRYFSKAFAEEWKYRPKLTGNFISISRTKVVEVLEHEFTMDEVWEAAKDCDGNKVPGPDGFNMICIQKCWKIMKGDVFQFMQEFYKNSKLAKRINSSFITLIPKKVNPEELADYRPICLIGVVYKILAKILSRRLKKVLPDVISEVQTAYDSINWEYLFDMMVNLGLGEKWLGWMKTCVTSARVSILVNGSPTEEFSPQKGLRQGDPLSPFLFNIAAEGLNLLLHRAKELGIFKGACVGPAGLRVSHLQFDADTILFCDAEWAEIVNAKRILRCFELISGLKINFHKSVVCGVGISDEVTQVFASKLCCLCRKLPIKYLGLPLGANPRRKKAWQPIVDKIRSKLALWKRKLLSFAGRLTLIKSVLDSLPGYYFSIFKLPKGVAREIEKIKATFLWGSSELKRKIHLVSLKEVTRRKDQGGLGIRKVSDMNDFLLAKWWWRYGVENKSLWKKVIISKYGAEGGRWLPVKVLVGNESYVWSDILNVARTNIDLFQFFISNFKIEVGNGNRIEFWNDKWFMNLLLKEEFPRLFRLSVEKEGTLSTFMQRRDITGDWKLLFRRSLLAWEEEEVRRLQELTRGLPSLNVEKTDFASWSASFLGLFTVASVRAWHEVAQGPRMKIPRMLWNNVAPPKAQFLCWLAWKGK